MSKVWKSLAQLVDEVPFAPVVAIVFGLAAGILVLATPGWLFERAVLASGLPRIIPAAALPLGEGAQMTAAILATSAMVGVLWLAFGPIDALMRPSVPQSRGHRIEPVYDAPGAEVEPIALARRPLFADADLGAPFMSDEAIAHAHDELVLETLAPIESTETPEPSNTMVDATPTLPRATEQTPTSGLLDGLERAIGHRERRTGSSAPILPGDVAALREVLGGSQLRH